MKTEHFADYNFRFTAEILFRLKTSKIGSSVASDYGGRQNFTCKVILITILLVIAPLHNLEADLVNLSENNYFDLRVSTGTTDTTTETSPADVPLKIVHPPEGANLPFLKSSFVFGSADPNGLLTINGKCVPVHPGGGFLTMVDYSPGRFQIQAELLLPSATYNITHTVHVASPPEVLTSTSTIIKAVQPEENISLPADDWIQIQCLGSPGAKVFFAIQGVSGKFPMAETEINKSGIYRGSYLIKENDDFQDANVNVVLVNELNGRKTSTMARGKVSVFNKNIPWIVEVATDTAKICTGSSLGSGDNAGYILFPLPGTRLTVIGKVGSELKVSLNKTRSGWISSGHVVSLPRGTPFPSTVIGTVNVKARDTETVIQMKLAKKIPFEVNPSLDGHTVEISFFGAISNTDWISYNTAQVNTRQVQWFQDDSQTYRLKIWNKDDIFWGYDARYDGQNFIFVLKSPPLLRTKSVLEGMTIALDAGHSRDTGAIGPTGLLEKEANRNIAQCLQKILLAEGAKVTMIRQNDEAVKLLDRPRKAAQTGADLLISIHNNALPEGGNPLEKNGFGVYYYYPQSFNLAREISSAYNRLLGKDSKSPTPLRDDGLYYGNLALARVPQMPAVIVESAYIIVPTEEALLKTEQFQQTCANAMLEGIKQYLTAVRRR